MKLDKKQLPQYLALGVLTAGLGGYSVYHFAAAGPVSADTRPAAAPLASHGAAPTQAAKLAGAAASAAVVAGTGDAPPPTPAMHDPFAVGYVDPGTLPAPSGAPAAPLLPPGKRVASLGAISPLPVGLPVAPPLPGSGLGLVPAKFATLPTAPIVPALPAALPPAVTRPDPPKWTVTGVLMGAGGKVAVLRSGDMRRIVRTGDFVDSVYRVTGVSRTAVQLRHGTLVYRIVLGADKPVPGASPGAFAPMPVPASAPMSVPVSAPPKIEMPAVMGSAIIPVYHSARPHLPLAHLKRQGPGMTLTAAAPMVPHATRKQPAAAKVARAISLGLRLLDGSVLASRKE